MDVIIFVLLLLTAACELALHYFPHWAEWTGRRFVSDSQRVEPRRLVVNYVAGTVAWFGPFSAWVWMTGDGGREAALVGWCFLLVAGLTVVGAYGYDEKVRERQALRDLRERVALQEKQRQDVESERVRPRGDAEA